VTESDEIMRGMSGAPSPIGPSEAGADALWQRFHRRLVIVGIRRLGSRADAEDAAQETLQRVTRALNENRLREPDALDSYGQEPDTTEHTSHPLTGLIDDERRRVVRGVLKTLPAEERQLLEQLYVQDADPLQLAERLGITPGALRVRKHRILKRLSDLLREAVMD